jgi:MFS family permease
MAFNVIRTGRLTRPITDPTNRTLIGLLGVVALSAVDGTIVSTAMPRVTAQIGGLDLYAWIFASFMLANTAATPVFGRFADRHGVRPTMAWALLIFLGASALAGLAATMPQLIACRALQGAGVGGMVTVAYTAFGLLYPASQRGRVQSYVSLVWGVASLGGPMLGGLMVTYLPWAWIFWINLPLGVLVVALAGRGLPGPQNLPLAGPQRSPETSLWHNRSFVVAVLLGFGACATMFTAINYLPLFVQGVQGRGAAEAGAVLTPMMVAWPLASAVAGAAMNRLGFRPLVVFGALLMVFGYAIIALPLVAEAPWRLVLPALLVGAGMGLITPTILVACQLAVPRHRIGVASAWLGVGRNLGGACGLALLGELQICVLHAGVALPGTSLRISLEAVFAGCAVVALLCVMLALLMPALRPTDLVPDPQNPSLRPQE